MKSKYQFSEFRAAFTVLLLWIALYAVLPLAFQGPTSIVCSGATCRPVNTTHWYWFGGYHAAFSSQGVDYPAVIKYLPTSSWELWLLVAASFIMAMTFYFGIHVLLGSRSTKPGA